MFLWQFRLSCLVHLSRLEKLNLTSVRTHAKIYGTIVTVGGAMIMTLVKGPIIEIIKTKGVSHLGSSSTGPDVYHTIIGSIMITSGCFCWACFMILQVRKKLNFSLEKIVTFYML